MKRVTNKHLVSKIEDIEGKLTTDELEEVNQIVKEIKEKLEVINYEFTDKRKLA